MPDRNRRIIQIALVIALLLLESLELLVIVSGFAHGQVADTILLLGAVTAIAIAVASHATYKKHRH
jgi:hypothetical protein